METKIIRTEYSAKDLMFIMEMTYPPDWLFEDTEEVFDEWLDGNGVVILLMDNGVPVGLIGAEPHENVLSYDPLMKPSPGRYYISEMAIIPEMRGLGGASLLLKALIDEFINQEVSQVSMHARISNGVNEMMKRRFKATDTRIVEDWCGYNGAEPAEYIEGDIKVAL